MPRESASQWVHLDVAEVTAVTENAIQVEIDGDSHWLPKSQIDEAEKFHVGDRDITVSVKEWLARERGLEGSD